MVDIKFYELRNSSNVGNHLALGIAVNGVFKHLFTIRSSGGNVPGATPFVGYNDTVEEIERYVQSSPCKDCPNEGQSKCTISAACHEKQQMEEISPAEARLLATMAARRGVILAAIDRIRRYS